jgi:phage baseplate assembly protein W
MAIGIRFPFQEMFEGGVFRYTKTTPEAIRTNLVSLLTTKKKQRVMNNNLYSPLYDQIFEVWDTISEDKLRSALAEKIKIYIPEVSVQDLIFTFDETTYVLTTKVVYFINSLGGIQDALEIDVNLQQNTV